MGRISKTCHSWESGLQTRPSSSPFAFSDCVPHFTPGARAQTRGGTCLKSPSWEGAELGSQPGGV